LATDKQTDKQTDGQHWCTKRLPLSRPLNNSNELRLLSKWPNGKYMYYHLFPTNIPTTRLVTVGDRAFTAADSRLLNSLPPDIRSAQTLPVFCNRLKTYLFSKCFPT